MALIDIAQKVFENPNQASDAEKKDYMASMFQQLKDLGFKDAGENQGAPGDQIYITNDQTHIYIIGAMTEKKKSLFSKQYFYGPMLEIHIMESQAINKTIIFVTPGNKDCKIKPGAAAPAFHSNIFAGEIHDWSKREKIDLGVVQWVAENAGPGIIQRMKAGVKQTTHTPKLSPGI